MIITYSVIHSTEPSNKLNASNTKSTTNKINLDFINIFDKVKVKIYDDHGNVEHIWIDIIDIELDVQQNEVILTGIIMYDSAALFDIIPEDTIIQVYRSTVVQYVPFALVYLT